MSTRRCPEARRECVPRPEVDEFCPECSEEGYYLPVWSHPLSSQEACRDPFTGSTIPGTPVERSERSDWRAADMESMCRARQNEVLAAAGLPPLRPAVPSASSPVVVVGAVPPVPFDAHRAIVALMAQSVEPGTDVLDHAARDLWSLWRAPLSRAGLSDATIQRMVDDAVANNPRASFAAPRTERHPRTR